MRNVQPVSELRFTCIPELEMYFWGALKWTHTKKLSWFWRKNKNVFKQSKLPLNQKVILNIHLCITGMQHIVYDWWSWKRGQIWASMKGTIRGHGNWALREAKTMPCWCILWETKLLSLNLFNMPWGLSFQSEVSYTYRNTSYTTNVQHFSNPNRQIPLTALITSRTGTVAWVLLTSLSGRALALPPGMSPKSRQPVFPASTYLLKLKKKSSLFLHISHGLNLTSKRNLQNKINKFQG